MEEPTKKQAEVLNFIKKFIVENGYPPSIREIGKGLDLSSSATVFVHLRNLEEKGLIRTTNNKFRTIELLVDNEYSEEKEDIIKVPLLGKVSCGSPIEAIENPTTFFDLPSSLVSGHDEIFTLETKGDSMINKGIFDGDIVIIKKQNVAHNGEMVVAMTEDNEVTLKTFYKENNHIRLQPENDYMSPIILDNCTILGKAIGLYRKL